MRSNGELGSLTLTTPVPALGIHMLRRLALHNTQGGGHRLVGRVIETAAWRSPFQH